MHRSLGGQQTIMKKDHISLLGTSKLLAQVMTREYFLHHFCVLFVIFQAVQNRLHLPEENTPVWAMNDDSGRPNDWQSEYDRRCNELKQWQKALLDAHTQSNQIAGRPPVERSESPHFFAWKQGVENGDRELKRQESQHRETQNDFIDVSSKRNDHRVAFVDAPNSPILKSPSPVRKYVSSSEYDREFIWPSHVDPFVHHHAPPTQILLNHVDNGEMKDRNQENKKSLTADVTSHVSPPLDSIPAGLITVHKEDSPTFFAWADQELQKVDLPPRKTAAFRNVHSEYDENYVKLPLQQVECIDRSSLNLFSAANEEPFESEYDRRFSGKHPNSPDSVAQPFEELPSAPVRQQQASRDGPKPVNFAWSLMEDEEATVATDTATDTNTAGNRTVDSLLPIPDSDASGAAEKEDAEVDIGCSEYETKFAWPLEKEPLVVRKAPPTQIVLSHLSDAHEESAKLHSRGKYSEFSSLHDAQVPAGVVTKAPESSPHFYAWKPLPAPVIVAPIITPAVVGEASVTEYKDRFSHLPLPPPPPPVPRNRDSVSEIVFGDGTFIGATEYDERFAPAASATRAVTPVRHQHVISLAHTNLDRYSAPPLPPPQEAPKTGRRQYPTEQNENFIWPDTSGRPTPTLNSQKSKVVIGLNIPAAQKLSQTSNTSHGDSSSERQQPRSITSPLSASSRASSSGHILPATAGRAESRRRTGYHNSLESKEFSSAFRLRSPTRKSSSPKDSPASEAEVGSDRRSAMSLVDYSSSARLADSAASADSMAAIDRSLKTAATSTIRTSTLVTNSPTVSDGNSSISSAGLIPNSELDRGKAVGSIASAPRGPFSQSLSSTASTVPFVNRAASRCDNYFDTETVI